MIRKGTSFIVFAIILIAFPAFFCFGQNSEQNALIHKIKTSKFDHKRVDLLNKLSVSYREDGDTEGALKYARKGLYLAKKIDDQVGVAVSYCNLGFAYNFACNNTQALRMHFLSLSTEKEMGRESGIADSYVNIGIIYDEQGDFNKSLYYYNCALSYGRRSNNLELIADVSHNLGITYYTLGNYPESLRRDYEALRLYDQLNESEGKANVYISLGNVYADQGKDSLALNMYYASLKLCKKLEDKLGIGNAYVNIGIIYDEQKRFDAARYMYNKAGILFKEIKDIEGQALIYISLSALHYKNGKYDEALKMCMLARELNLELEDNVEINNSNVTLARIYLKQGKLENSRKLLDATLKASIDIGHKLYVKDAYKVYVELDSIAGDYEAAFKHQKLWLAYRDSINNNEAEKKSYQTSLQYSFDKKAASSALKHEKAIAVLNERNKLSSQKQVYLVIILVVFGCSASVVWYFSRRLYNNRKKLSEVLANENAHKETLLQEVHHRVNNSLQMISSLLSIQADSTDNEEIREYLLKSENRIQAMSVMHQLLHLGNSKLEVNMRDYLGEVLDFYTDLLVAKPNVKLNFTVPSVMFHTKTAMPLALILNELITNSLKYAFPTNEGTIDVSLVETEPGHWIFNLSDDGIGFITTESNQENSSIGLSLVHLMTKQMGGKLEMSTDRGTSVKIAFKQATL